MSANRLPRGRRGTAATVTATLGLLSCAAVATEAVSMAAHGRTVGYRASDLARFARDTHLGDQVVVAVSIGAVVLGVVLVLAALLPPRRRSIELTEPEPAVAAGVARRSLRRTLAAAAMSVDGVSGATVTGRRRLKVVATTSLRNTAALPGDITDRVTARLDELNPARPRTVRIVLDRKDG